MWTAPRSRLSPRAWLRGSGARPRRLVGANRLSCTCAPKPARAETGTVLAVPSGGDLLVVAVGEPDVNVGLARLEMLHLVERGI